MRPFPFTRENFQRLNSAVSRETIKDIDRKLSWLSLTLDGKYFVESKIRKRI